jgi:hypothetical protein
MKAPAPRIVRRIAAVILVAQQRHRSVRPPQDLQPEARRPIEPVEPERITASR